MSDRERGEGAASAAPGGAPWWAGLRVAGGVVLAVIGAGLLVWLVLRGDSADEDWARYYGAGKVLAIGCVIAGTALVARRR